MSSSHILFHGARCRKKNAKRKNGTSVLLCGEQILSLAVFLSDTLPPVYFVFARCGINYFVFSR